MIGKDFNKSSMLVVEDEMDFGKIIDEEILRLK